jgi:acid phosphatase family membrane protein YuiD
MNGSKFLKFEKPPLVAMVQEKTAEGAIAVIMNSLAEGAEAFGIQLCYLTPEYRTEEKLKLISGHTILEILIGMLIGVAVSVLYIVVIL